MGLEAGDSMISANESEASSSESQELDEESEDDDESSLSESESEWGCDAVVLPIHAATPCRPTQAKLGVRTSICADTADRV